MNYTRVNNEKLRQAVAEASAHLEAAHSALDKYLELCTEAERSALPKPPNAFPAAARALAQAVQEIPEIVSVTEFDAQAVVEDLNNVDALQPVDVLISRITQLVSDTRLHWLAEAYVPSLQVYGVAKVRAKNNAKLQQTIAPLAAVFATKRSKKKDG